VAGTSNSTHRAKGHRKKRIVPVAVEPEASRLALNVPQAAWLLGTSPNFVWGLLTRGQIESFHLGSKRMIARAEVERFIAEGGTKASAE
jgi:excisionase family DNA binding protein